MKLTMMSYEESVEELKNEPLLIGSPQRFENITTEPEKNTDGPSPIPPEQGKQEKSLPNQILEV